MMQDEINTKVTTSRHLPLADSADAVRADAIKGYIEVGSPFDTLEALDMVHGYVMLRAARSFQGVSERYANALAHKIHKAGLSAIKADELSHSTQTGFGDEWVPDLWSSQIWQKARQDNVILPLCRGIEMEQTLKGYQLLRGRSAIPTILPLSTTRRRSASRRCSN